MVVMMRMRMRMKNMKKKHTDICPVPILVSFSIFC